MRSLKFYIFLYYFRNGINHRIYTIIILYDKKSSFGLGYSEKALFRLEVQQEHALVFIVLPYMRQIYFFPFSPTHMCMCAKINTKLPLCLLKFGYRSLSLLFQAESYKALIVWTFMGPADFINTFRWFIFIIQEVLLK